MCAVVAWELRVAEVPCVELLPEDRDEVVQQLRKLVDAGSIDAVVSTPKRLASLQTWLLSSLQFMMCIRSELPASGSYTHTSEHIRIQKAQRWLHGLQ